MTERTDATSPRSHGRRARRLSPEEAAELEQRTAQEPLDQTGPIPPLRGAVAPPTADAPVPKLRKFGKRARIVELDEAPAEGSEVPVTGENEPIRDDRQHAPAGEDVVAVPDAQNDESSVPSGADSGDPDDDGSAGLPGDAETGSQDPIDAPQDPIDGPQVPIDAPQEPGAEASSEVDESSAGLDDAPSGVEESGFGPDADPSGPEAGNAPEVEGSGADSRRWTPPAAPDGGSGGVATSSSHDAAWNEPATDNLRAITDEDVASASAGGVATAVRAPARDSDGVELGEMSVTDAPDPRPAPRFDGKVLHRPERSGSQRMVWVIWALIAIAVIVLVVLLVTGVIGGTTSALSAAESILAAGGVSTDIAPWRGTTA